MRRLQEFRFESRAGSWRLWQWIPSPCLAPAVVSLWATDAETADFRESVVPRETVELMLNLGGPQTLESDGRRQTFRHGWVSGLQDRCLRIHSPTPARLVAASLHPAYAGPLLGIAGEECSRTVAPLDDLLPSATRNLLERLQACPDVAARFLCLEQFLSERLRVARQPNPAACYSIHRILGLSGRLAIRSLREELRCSARYLEKQLASHTGFTPKQLSRLVRFSRAIESLRQETPTDWGRFAAGCGFYDQSHFTREFRQFTGATPGEFLIHRDPSTQALLLG